jgi:hypothetical protein
MRLEGSCELRLRRKDEKEEAGGRVRILVWASKKCKKRGEIVVPKG